MDTEQIEHARSRHDDPGALLATGLSVNALFSGGCGLVLAAGAPALSGPFGVPAWLLVGLGVGLLAFAALLLWILAEPGRLVTGGRFALGADLAWIGGVTLLLAAFPDALTTVGSGALVAATVAVAVLATGQALGLRRIGGRAATGTSRLALRAQRVVDAPPERVWAAVADAGDYARFAPGIAATEIVSGEGQGMVRSCTDDRGARWLESCTLMEEGRRYRMTVDVDTYPVYYRILLHELAQTWCVEPAPGGTRLTLAFDGAVKLGVVGRLAGARLGRQGRLDAILDAYARELSA